MRMSHGDQCVHMHALCLTHCKMSVCTTDIMHPPFPPIDSYYMCPGYPPGPTIQMHVLPLFLLSLED